MPHKKDEASHKVSQEELRRKFTREDAYFYELEQQRLVAAQARSQRRRMVCKHEGAPPEGCLLEEVRFHGVVLDRCPTCKGIWVDTHELEEIVHNLHDEQFKEHHDRGFLQSIVDSLKPLAE